MNQLGQFEQNLLAELREVVAERAAAPQPRPRRRLVLATAGGGLLAAGLLVGIPAMSNDQAAYAVATNDDGTVTITVNRLEDPEGLERELAAHGVTADVTFAPPGKICHYMPPHESSGMRVTLVLQVARDGDTITVRSADLKGRTLVLQSRRQTISDPDGAKPFVISYGFADRPMGPCELVDEPYPEN